MKWLILNIITKAMIGTKRRCTYNRELSVGERQYKTLALTHP